MQINLIIATYGGIPLKHKENRHKKHYLRLNLECLNTIKTSITHITIMKPKINAEDIVVEDYYDFSCLNIENIRDKIKIYECDNIGISYGQYFAGIANNLDCDIHFWIEDDYLICADNFDKKIMDFMKEYNLSQDTHVCPFIYTNRKWDIVPYAESINEEPRVIDILRLRLNYYDLVDIKCHIPDMMQLGVLTKYSVTKILDVFKNFTEIYYLFSIPFTKIWLHQILFGYVLYKAGIYVEDTAKVFTNIFYETSIDKIFLCNYPENVNTWKERQYNGEKLLSPLCFPTEIVLYPERYHEDMELMKRYITNREVFDKQIDKIGRLVHNSLKCMEHNICLRKLEEDDFDKGYMDLMFEFTNYKYAVNKEEFGNYLFKMKNICSIYVIYSYKEQTIIGAGTIFKLEKLHNNPVGQIEDFVIRQAHQKKGLGQLLLQKLIDVGLYNFKCYKIILKTHNETCEFYEKSGFVTSGLEMKLV